MTSSIPTAYNDGGMVGMKKLIDWIGIKNEQLRRIAQLSFLIPTTYLIIVGYGIRWYLIEGFWEWLQISILIPLTIAWVYFLWFSLLFVVSKIFRTLTKKLMI